MARIKYVIAENNLKQQVAVIFAREIDHPKFICYLKVVSAGFFSINDSNKVELMEEDVSIRFKHRKDDDKIISDVINNESKYIITKIKKGGTKKTVVVVKDNFLYEQLSVFLEADSCGLVDILRNKIVPSQPHDNSIDDIKLVESFKKNGIMGFF